MNEFEISDIGGSLVAHSQEQDIPGRGLASALFPYIYTAAKRMSTRAISAYLQEKHGVRLSAVTIAKALREPEKHVLAVLERVEPAARTVGMAHNLGPEDLLNDADLFESVRNRPPELWPGSQREIAEGIHEYKAALECLAKEWFELPTDLRLLTLGLLEKQQPGGASDAE
jgi:hypothetical protein